MRGDGGGVQLTRASAAPAVSKLKMLHQDRSQRGGDGGVGSPRQMRGNRGPNVLILSGAGKPIFVRYGSSSFTDRTYQTHRHEHHQQEQDTHGDEGGSEEEEWATACSLLQALRANVMSFGLYSQEGPAAPLGDIQSIKAGRKIIVFVNTEALTLVAISDDGHTKHNNDCIETEAWLRLQLEYVYSHVVFTLTDQVQSIFKRSPSYDLRNMMGHNVNASLRNLLDRFDSVDLDSCGEEEGAGGGNPTQGTGCGSFLTASVECISPIPSEVRDQASRMLINACCFGGGEGGNNSNNNPARPVFAILMVGTRLVTLVQPPNPSSQLHTSDLHLVLTFVGMQPGLLTNELWFPMCLPRFDSSGFLYAYTSCLDTVTGLSIVLISPNNSTEQFETFRFAANTLRKNLGLRPVNKSKVLRIYESTSTASSVSTGITDNHDLSDDKSGNSEGSGQHFDDAAWERQDTAHEDLHDDYEDDDVSTSIVARIRPAVGDAKPRLPIGERQVSTTNYLSNSTIYTPPSPEKEKEEPKDEPLIAALTIALLPKTQDDMIESYLRLASAAHFCFRCDIFSSHPDDIGHDASGGMLSQCFGPPISFPFVDASSQRHVWNVYQRLSLRLRLGSSSVESTMDALDMITDAQRGDDNSVDYRGISRDCPAQCLFESPPNIHGVTYVQENDWLYVGLNGKFFELYATLPSTITPRTGTAYCARLVRTLMGDERILFLSNPMTWTS